MSLLTAVREANWLNPERARVYGWMILIAFLASAIWISVANTLIFHTPDPLGGDFLSFYAASKLALAGHAADAWRPEIHGAVENSLFGGDHGYLAFFYPPPYLLACFPLALLPFGVALCVWLGVTTAAGVAALRAYLKGVADIPLGWMPLIAFPAVWINMSTGQNGALTLAILATGFWLADRRPILAGLVLGLLVVKPQLAIVLPLAFAVTGRWKTFLATGLSAAALCVIAYLAFGTDAYAAFWANSQYASQTLNNGLVDPALMQSLFAALRQYGAPLPVAYGAHALLATGILGALTYLALTRKPDAYTLGALCVAATLLVTPFSLKYDLLISAVPLGWLAVTGMTTGFRPWEKSVLLLAFFLPLLTRTFSVGLHLPIAPLVLLAIFVLVCRRVAALPVRSAYPWQRLPAAARP
ncbi:hypothetical protein AEAC466_12630 [Asticcacaulis sp. AC466]|uniref:glycosyltransferase family 87 protein n=1 Tax=Asticcacaulis sp. AC466 TaxID=1282362 RepID=UPI0003C4019B|nr:glycosyltransferase family 87 protein [Asticcacaulis sp. AC466]ESQ83515.1 hypothetical protein AEAC466_12630 [Asticcacaulis sp. AC466]